MITTKQAKELGTRIAERLEQGDAESGYEMLEPLLHQRIPFAMLDRVAREFGQAAFGELDAFLDLVSHSETIGSWALIGTALVQHLDDDLVGALERERMYAILGGLWYAADAMGERTAGQALVNHFDETLKSFAVWRADENSWVRRSIGVGVHVWAKRTRGAEALQARRLLQFLEPLWGESEMDAVKGVGWGLKTIGRYYPDLMSEWLEKQRTRPHRALMMRKATTYLNEGD